MVKPNLKIMNLKNLYLTRIEELDIEPNFFLSETYLNQNCLIGKSKNNWIWIEDDGQPIFPAIPINKKALEYPYPITNCWAGFNIDSTDVYRKSIWEFLDWQYLYNPKAFLNMVGGEWASFRKNSRKFIKRNPNCTYTWRRDDKQVRLLLSHWMERNQETVQDPMFIIQCILKPTNKEYIKYMYNEKKHLIAINFADENWKYINYRFIICKKEPFADEYARLCFYLDPYIQNKNKLVNDGGTLGNPGLEKFKDKLNPISKTQIYSWTNIL